MIDRNSVRYGSDFLRKSLSKVTLSWGADSSIESDVTDCCAHGIRVLIPPMQDPMNIPKKNDTVKVFIPVDHVWLTGMCVYATTTPDDSIFMGIYFYHPSEQNYMNNLLSITLHVSPEARSFVCHEWEELVDKLCNSDDPKLKKIGYQEKDALRV